MQTPAQRIDKKHNFYLIKFSNGLVKVGIGNVENRIRSHKSTASIFDVNISEVFTDHVADPRLIESMVMHQLGLTCSGIRAREWFKDAEYGLALTYFNSIKHFVKNTKTIPAKQKNIFECIISNFNKKTNCIQAYEDYHLNGFIGNKTVYKLIAESKSAIKALGYIGAKMMAVVASLLTSQEHNEKVDDWDLNWLLEVFTNDTQDEYVIFDCREWVASELAKKVNEKKITADIANSMLNKMGLSLT